MAITNENKNNLITLGQLNDIVKVYIDREDAKSIKTVFPVGNKLNFYKVENPVTTGDTPTAPDYSWDVPAEIFLSAADTGFKPAFTWSDTEYPNSENPNLDNQPVIVLGVKTVTAAGVETINYSFIPLSALVDTYVGSDSIEIDETGENPAIKAKLSKKTDNVLEIVSTGTDDEKGLYVAPTAADGNKADKLKDVEGEDPVVKENQILLDDGNGNLKGSGLTIDEMFAAHTASDADVTAVFGITLS